MRRGFVLGAMLLSMGSGPDAGARPPERAEGVPARTSPAPDAPRPATRASATPEPGTAPPPSASTEASRGTPAGDAARRADPLALDDADLARLVETDLGALGSLSLGRPNAGALVGGVAMPMGAGWEVVDPGRSWATRETADYLVRAFAKLRSVYPDAPPVFVGHLSRERGGPLGPHRSHQSGRDVDLGYLHKPGMHAWYQRASARTLDLGRTWALVRALVTESDVEVMFMDLAVQKLLKEHALAVGEDPQWLDSLFRYQSKHPSPLIRQAWGHSSHMHVRFYNPRAQALGIRCYSKLADLGLISPRMRVVRYQAKAGDSIDALAARAGTKAATIRQFNRLDEGELSNGKIYLVPVRGQVAEVKDLVIEPRRLPPERAPALPASAAQRGRAGSSTGGRAAPSP